MTTVNEDLSTNISPMGPIVDSESFRSFQLRPFNTSTTYRNLKRLKHGTLHVTDDVLLIARAAIDRLNPEPPIDSPDDARRVLSDCCHWFEFEVSAIDDSTERTTIGCEVVDSGQKRPFFGFNRAKHAVLEAAILATRLQLIDEAEVRQQLHQLFVIVDKTAGPNERSAFDLIRDHAEQFWNGDGRTA